MAGDGADSGRVVPAPRRDRPRSDPGSRRLPPLERRLRPGRHAHLRLDRRRRLASVRGSRHLCLPDAGRFRTPAPGRCGPVGAWSAERSEESLREAVALGLVAGALYQVQTYRALLPTLMGNGANDELTGADLNWLNRALLRHQQGLETPM